MRTMLGSPQGPRVIAPANILEKMIRNRNRVSTRGYDIPTGLEKPSVYLETVTNSDIYLNSAFTIPTRV